MAGGDARHAHPPSGRRMRRWGSGLVLAVLLLAVASYSFDLGPRVLGWERPSPVTEPAEVGPPPGLVLPDASPAAAVAEVSPEKQADPVAVRRVVRGMVRDDDLGRRVAVAVSQPGEDVPLLEAGPSTVTPASTMKLLTTTAVLAALGPDHEFGTTVVAGARPRDVVLVGGGDPLLARRPAGDDAYPRRADLATLARATARSLKQVGRTKVRLGYDTSLFRGPAVSPTWPASYVSDHVISRVSPLWVDEGREREGQVYRAADPALGAANEFARALRKQGITVQGKPRRATASPDAEEYARVTSAPLSQIAQWVLEVSDNEAAEVLLRHVALAEGRPGSFDGGSAAVRDVLERLDVDLVGARIHDGSGLSRKNRLSVATLLEVLEVATSPDHPGLRPVAAGLPVAGFTGSLSQRFETAAPAGLGRVRAKTGTLTGVHGLAGVVTDRTGTVLTFAVVADRVKVENTLDAREQLDQLAAALAACRCAA